MNRMYVECFLDHKPRTTYHFAVVDHWINSDEMFLVLSKQSLLYLEDHDPLNLYIRLWCRNYAEDCQEAESDIPKWIYYSTLVVENLERQAPKSVFEGQGKEFCLRWDPGLLVCLTISPYFTISLQFEIRGHVNIKKGKIEVF